MIQANELRVGNWVKLIDTDRFYTVSFPLHNDLAEQWHTALDYCEPIPLTPEILEKCGFEQNRDGFYQLQIKGGFTIECFATGGRIPSDGTPTKFGFNLIVATGRQAISATSFSLHQLQNLYYALTGTELTITL